MALGIVAAINRQEDAAEIWNRVYEELAERCVRMIHEGTDEEAFRLYKGYSMGGRKVQELNRLLKEVRREAECVPHFE